MKVCSDLHKRRDLLALKLSAFKPLGRGLCVSCADLRTILHGVGNDGQVLLTSRGAAQPIP